MECAQQCALNAIAAVKAEIGDLTLVKRIVKVVVFVASTPDFTGQPGVANGASELFGEVFGDAGRHARSAVGVAVLPLDAPVEVELIVEVLIGPDRRRCPTQLVGRARAYADGAAEPAEPRDAATVVLLRPADRRRAPSGLPAAPAARRWPSPPACASSPAAGSTSATSTRRSGGPGPSPADWAARLGRRRATTRGPWSAPRSGRRSRSRGVLLAGPSDDAVVEDTTGDDWEADRHALEAATSRSPSCSNAVAWCCAPTCWASGRLADAGVRAARYRTWFFVAVLPRASAPATSRPSPTR